MGFFTLQATDGFARTGVLRTRHGDVPTPAFMPVATYGSVKALDPADLHSIGAQIVLSNTYHLYLRPGVEIIQKLGGMHKFMKWDGPILTDSGGFQGFSLRHLRKITDEAMIFKSHIDGSIHTFTPEGAIRYQVAIGSDLVMPLDICVPADATKLEADMAVEQTTRWAERSLEVELGPDQHLFGIVQGGTSLDLRERSALDITRLGFPGYAIGGLSVGESKDVMYTMTESTTKLLSADAPRYLMGVGSPEDLVECVARGIDMFDCVLPTRIARNGALLVRSGRLNIDKASFREKEGPIEEGCDCYACTFPAAYVHHLFRSGELLAYRLATIHNLSFILRLMAEMRESIKQGTFEEYRTEFNKEFTPPDPKSRLEQKKKWELSQRRKSFWLTVDK